jgi:predicted DNA-binding mobile mystery protein A
MASRAAARRARLSLDVRMSRLGPPEKYTPPYTGWVRAIRDALGMSAMDLGQRMGVSGSAIGALERNERDGTARLDTLRRAASALDCTLVYAFIPNSTLEHTRRHRAEQLARHQLSHVATTMALEDQAVAIDQNRLNDQVDRILESGRLWAEDQ